jgi:hypothetical protein
MFLLVVSSLFSQSLVYRLRGVGDGDNFIRVYVKKTNHLSFNLWDILLEKPVTVEQLKIMVARETKRK